MMRRLRSWSIRPPPWAMDEVSPSRAKEPLSSRLERLQDRTLRVRPREGAGLISKRDLKRDRAN